MFVAAFAFVWTCFVLGFAVFDVVGRMRQRHEFESEVTLAVRGRDRIVTLAVAPRHLERWRAPTLSKTYAYTSFICIGCSDGRACT